MKYLYKLYEKFCVMQWSIGFARADIKQMLLNKKIDLTYTWLPVNDASTSIADPFILANPNGNINLLYENFSMVDAANYGKIELTELDNQFKPIKNKRLLDTKSHLSYPFIFEEAGKTYIIPEAHQSNGLTAFEYDFATDSLINERIIIDKLPLIDSSILKYNNKYWLFATLGDGTYDHSKLYIYFADSLFGNYTAHPHNPVKFSADGSRPAGNFIVVDGDIYRPAQNCAEYYGKSITINKILTLTETAFSEEPYMILEQKKNSEYNAGLHTLNVLGDIIVVDGIKMTFNPWLKISMFLRKKMNRK